MDKRIKSLYILMTENKAVICESNLTKLFEQLPAELQGYKGYDFFYKQMQETDYLILPFNARYALQRMDY